MTALATLLGTTGRAFLCALHVFLRICVLIVDTLYWAFIQPFRGRGPLGARRRYPIQDRVWYHADAWRGSPP